MTSTWHRLFLEYVDTLEPYLDQLVIVGGWAPYVYARKYGWDEVPQPLQTYDFDVAVMQSFEDRLPSIAEMLSEAGYSCEYKGNARNPAIDYVKAGSSSESREVQFIAPFQADGADVVKIGSLDVVALLHVSMLIENVRKLNLSDLGFSRDTFIQVPELGAFVAHKLVMHELRPQPSKRRKDLYYAFYVLDSFPIWLDATLETAHRIIAEKGLVSRVQSILQREFADIDSSGVNAVVSQYPDSINVIETDEQKRQRVLATMWRLYREL